MSELHLMTTSEAATFLRVTERVIRELIRSGKLPAAKIGREFRIKKAELEKLLDTPIKE